MTQLLGAPLFADRADAGRVLGQHLEAERDDAVVVGLARGGVVVAAEVATRLDAPLDVVAVRKVRHPWQPEYAIGAVAPGEGAYVRDVESVTRAQLDAAVARARAEMEVLDRALHAAAPQVPLDGRTCILVDDGLATGATMVAAARWARGRRARRVVAAVPVAAADSLSVLAGAVDAVVCPHPVTNFIAVGLWYGSFTQVDDEEVRRLLAAGARAAAGAPAETLR